MKTAETRWSGHVWFWGFVFLFLGHAFAVFWFADRRNLSPSWQKPAAFFYFGDDADTGKPMAEIAALRDPTLFALPHVHGFSGAAWLNFRPQVPALSNWFAPREWLSLPTDQLGTSLDEYVATNRPSEEQLLASLRATKVPEVRIPDEPIVTRSYVKVEDPRATRKLVRVPPLPAITHNDVLKRTVVAVSVNGDGRVESASLVRERESGSKQADESAVELARTLEFAPLPIRDAQAREMAAPTLLHVIFAWQVIPPTNNAAATAGAP
jgi:TonB family protein